MLLFNLWIDIWIDSMNLNWLEKFELPHKRFCPPNIIWIYLSESASVVLFLLRSINLITEFVGFFVVFWILIVILIFVERWFLFGKMYHSDWKWLSPVALLLSPYVMLWQNHFIQTKLCNVHTLEKIYNFLRKHVDGNKSGISEI